MRVVSHDEAMAALDYRGLIDFMESEHRREPALVTESYVASEAGDGLLARTGFSPGHGLGVKLASVFPANTDRPTIHSVYVLFDATDGTERAVIAGNAITWFKTACDSALAARFLARPDSRTLLMVGAGSMAPHLIGAHAAAVPSIERILLWNRTAARAERVAATSDVDIEVVDDLASAVGHADVVSVATMSAEPIILGRWVRPGTHVDLVGAYTPTMREADDELIGSARLFVDSRESAEPIGELAIPRAAGVLDDRAVLGDLYDLAAGTEGRASETDVTVFKNGGGGHLDLMTARYILERVG